MPARLSAKPPAATAGAGDAATGAGAGAAAAGDELVALPQAGQKVALSAICAPQDAQKRGINSSVETNITSRQALTGRRLGPLRCVAGHYHCSSYNATTA